MVNLSSSCTESHPDEGKRAANNITNKLIHSASDNHVKFLSSSKPVVDVKVVRGPSRRSIESLHANRRSTKPVISDFSQKHPRQPFYPTTRLYASPLEIDRSVLPGNEIRQLGRNRSLGCSQSLHMKFPKDFTLPSKEDLVKKFGVFGPLEYRRTKVVFLDPHDAAAAYQFLKRKSVFGKAMGVNPLLMSRVA
ncbi:hypothetical protein QJS10_CPB04g00532 [Acorus calamus]|uniref:RRM domain-containing protein n=1 Tax=Acorus calamus TaxID=4465 RepID=A0AAV9EZS2_ACOCL|nr:hypothetical protein QJS10_CPB04g00532 [Acorus calamus]